jgi:hypothetical protein
MYRFNLIVRDLTTIYKILDSILSLIVRKEKYWPASRHDNIIHTCCYPPALSQFWRGKIELTGFSFDFKFFPILKYKGGASNEDINIHPEPIHEPAPPISNYILHLLNDKPLNCLKL